MAAKVCLKCTAVYAADAQRCPQCQSTQSRFDWEDSVGATAPATGGVVTAAESVVVDTAATGAASTVAG